MKKLKFILFYFLFLILIYSVFASSHLPEGLLKAKEANQQAALNYINILTIAIAFLAGMTSIFSPCILPLLPAFFSYTFNSKKDITKMTLIFFLGFVLSFISLGLIASFFFKSTLLVLQDNISFLVRIFGLALIVFGAIALFGIGFSGFKFNYKFKNNYIGVFIYGIIFAFGWSACLGPILGGVLLMVSVFSNYFTAFYLMLFYSLGIFVPLFLLSIYFDKSQFLRKKYF